MCVSVISPGCVFQSQLGVDVVRGSLFSALVSECLRFYFTSYIAGLISGDGRTKKIPFCTLGRWDSATLLCHSTLTCFNLLAIGSFWQAATRSSGGHQVCHAVTCTLLKSRFPPCRHASQPSAKRLTFLPFLRTGNVQTFADIYEHIAASGI